MSTEELQSTKGGNVLPHEATLVMSGNSVISDLNSMSKFFEHAGSCLKEKRRQKSEVIIGRCLYGGLEELERKKS